MKKFFIVALVSSLFTTGMFTSCLGDNDDPGFDVTTELTADKKQVCADSDTVNFELRAFAVDHEKHGKAVALIDRVIWHLVTPDMKDSIIGHQEDYALEVAKLKQAFNKVGQCIVYSEMNGHFGDWTFYGVSDTVVVSVVQSDKSALPVKPVYPGDSCIMK